MHHISPAATHAPATSGAAAAGQTPEHEQHAQVAQALIHVDNAAPDDGGQPAPQAAPAARRTDDSFCSCPAHGPTLHAEPIQAGQAVVPKDASDIENDFALLLERLGTHREHQVGLYKALSDRVGLEDTGHRFIPDTIARYPEIPTARHTRILGDKLEPVMPGNLIQVNGTDIAIATQYPLRPQLETFLRALFERRTTLLVVLASDDEIDNIRELLPRYFGDKPVKEADEAAANGVVAKQYGRFKVEYHGYSESEKLDGGLEYKLYGLIGREYAMKDGQRVLKRIPLWAMHVENWPAHERFASGPAAKYGGVTTEALEQLVAKMKSVHEGMLKNYKAVNSRSVGVPGRVLPAVYGTAGVGRTGMLIAAYALLKDKSLSLEAVVTDLRESRNPRMVQTNHQLRGLYALARKNGNPILRPEHQDPPRAPLDDILNLPPVMPRARDEVSCKFD